MFQLKYKVTDADINAVNKRVMLFWFAIYLAVAAVGIAVGIVAVVFNVRTSITVMGIIILVFSGLLAVLALLMLILPRNYVASAVAPSDDELDVTVDKHGITVNGGNIAQFADITAIKRRKDCLWVYVGKNVMLLVKPNIVSGQSSDELYSYMSERQGRLLIEPTVKEPVEAAEEKPEKSDTPADAE